MNKTEEKIIYFLKDDIPELSYFNKLRIEVKELRKYKKGFDILSEYFDSISDEEKPKVHRALKRVGL